MPSTKHSVQDKARELGFARCLVTTAEPVSADGLAAWLNEHKHGAMRYMARDPLKRCDPANLLPGAKSVICCALVYGKEGVVSDRLPFTVHRSPESAARFARGADYHEVVREKLGVLAEELKRLCPEAKTKCCVDTSPLLEKALGERAGLGWIGKNTLLISSDLGSWFVLGEIITDVELAPDAPLENRCGACRTCLDACPTNALGERSLDARRCISYLTIEHRGEVAPDLAQHIPHNAYGCDICQAVCPYNANR